MPTPKEELSKYIETSEMSTGYIEQTDIISVGRYGAVAGSTESQAATIESAMSAAINQGSQLVFFPVGDYHTTALSTNQESLKFIGDQASFTTSYSGSTYVIHQIYDINTINNLVASSSGNVSFVSGDTSLLTVDSTGSTITLTALESTNITALQSTVASFTTSISALYEATSSNSGRLTVVEADVSSHATRLTNLESTVASHTTSITALYEATSSNSGRLTAVEADVSSHATRLTNLESTVASHTTSITRLYDATSSNAGLITTLQTDLNTHTTDTSKHLTIMTTPGDIIYYSTDSAPARLAKGAANQVLVTSVNGVPAWDDITSVSTEFDGIELLAWMLGGG